MNRTIKNFFIAAIFAAFLFGAKASSAQTPKAAEPSFDVVLQTVVASNDGGSKSNVSPSLSNIVKNLKADFPFSAYRLTSTFVQRVSNHGNFESKSVSYDTSANKNIAVFSEWGIGGVEALANENGRETIQIHNFRFGQRIPIQVVNERVDYEPVGLSSKFSLAKDTPTVVGSITTSKPDELMFLVLTVKSAEK